MCVSAVKSNNFAAETLRLNFRAPERRSGAFRLTLTPAVYLIISYISVSRCSSHNKNESAQMLLRHDINKHLHLFCFIYLFYPYPLCHFIVVYATVSYSFVNRLGASSL